MHICLAGPVNIADLADLLPERDRPVAAGQPRANTTAPGAIARVMHERGHQVTVVTMRQGQGQLELRGGGITILQVDGRPSRLQQTATRWSAPTRAMADAISAVRPDVVHSNWAYEAALAAVRSGLPHVATVRDAPWTVVGYYPRPDRWVRLTMPYELRARAGRSSIVTAVSPYLARAWQRQTRWPVAPRVVPNIAPAAASDTVAVQERPPVLVEVADGGRRKNVRTLLRAFGSVRRRRPAATLRLIGPHLAPSGDLDRWAEARGLADGVEFLGPRDPAEVRAQLAGARAHVHAALEETFGNTLAEAMSVGTPVIGGVHSGAVPWVLDHGRAGVLVDVRSAPALAGAMIALLDDAVLPDRLAVAGARRARTMFSDAAVAPAYEQAYAEAIAVRGKSASAFR